MTKTKATEVRATGGAARGGGPRVVTGELHRVRRGRRKVFVAAAPAAKPVAEPEAAARPARVALMLALAWKIQEAIDRGVVRDRAEVARRMGVTRARVTQILDLCLLAPHLQEKILLAQGSDMELTARVLRKIVGGSLGRATRPKSVPSPVI